MSNTPDYITPEGEELYDWEMENRTEQTLDELYPMFQVGYLSYEAGRVLREIDPIAFRECVLEKINSMMEDGELDEWREDHPWREEQVEWTEHRDDIFGRIFRRFTATRRDGTGLQVSESGTSKAERPVWDAFVQSASGCCEYLAELEDMTAMDAMAHAEEVDLYADASGTDFEDCPNCKH